MKALIMRCLLVLTLSFLLILAVLLPGIKNASPVSAYSPPPLAPEADYHLWEINEVFSCADGSIQFIELFTSLNGQEVLANHQLRATNLNATQIQTFTFSQNSGAPTAGKFLLLATANFGALTGGVTPDYVISSTFVFTEGGSLAILPEGDAFSYVAGALPLDGFYSLAGNGTATQLNSPKNFAGQEGSVKCPGAVTFIYLPVIFKEFPIISEHSANLDYILPEGD